MEEALPLLCGSGPSPSSSLDVTAALLLDHRAMPLLLRPPSRRPSFDAVVIARERTADAKVLGLTLRERARRVAQRVGAQRVYVVDGDVAAAGLTAWRAKGDNASAVLIIWADDQVVHMPLVEPLLDSDATRAVAITPEGAFAGAALADAGAAPELLAAPMQAARAWMARDDAARVEHGQVARHAASTRLERAAAARWLEQIVHKEQDGPITRWLYRPVSLPLSRLLVRTPITPNQISLVVAILGAIGIYFTAQYSYDAVVIGSSIILVAAYLDGCDGEIARLKLRSSRLGAWVDTITDEFTTVFYLAALGYHNYLHRPEPWVAGTIVFGVVSYLVTIYAIYYYLVVVHGTANSQDYVDKLEIVDGALRPIEHEKLTGVWAVLAHVPRRDFINWGALGFAALHWTHIAYAGMLAGGALSIVKVVLIDHLRLRRQIKQLTANS